MLLRNSALRSNVRGTRRGREDVVIVDEWVPLGLASQGLEQANQCVAEGAEALDFRRDELAAYALRKWVVLVLLVLLLGGSGDAGGDGHGVEAKAVMTPAAPMAGLTEVSMQSETNTGK